MIRRIVRNIKRVGELYMMSNIPRSSAALAYSLTMSLFPLIICLYTLLGKNYDRMLQILELADKFLSPETTRYLKSFLLYVANNPNPAMLAAALALLLTTASAAVRMMRQGLTEIRGGKGGTGLRDWFFSFLFSLAFVAVLYFGILVMHTGQLFLEFVERALPMLPVSRAWNWMRFLVLGGLVFLTLWGMYALSERRRERRKGAAAGALTATAGIVLMNWLFSVCIAASSRYPLVYGSLASIILLMFWLFLCGQLIFLGAAVQVVFGERDRKKTDSGE
jgi:membrane protein